MACGGTKGFMKTDSEPMGTGGTFGLIPEGNVEIDAAVGAIDSAATGR